MITQEQLDLIANPHAFNPPPEPVPTWERVVEILCAIALVGIVAAYFWWRV